MRITIDVLDKKSISQGIRDLKTYKRDMKRKANELCEKCAEYGADIVGTEYSSVRPWESTHGNPDFSIDIAKKKNGYAIKATGEDVLFLEYGAGAAYGSQDADVDYSDSEGFVVQGGKGPYGPGSYPNGKGHWNDPHGWYLPGMHYKRSFGNPPSMGMYHAKKEIERNLEKFKEEIFNG